MNSLRIAQDFVRGLSLWLDLLGGSSVRRETCLDAGRFLVGAMTPVIFITIGFLSCWFLLYALVEWTQDPKRKPGVRRGAETEISQRQRRASTSSILEPKKDPRRERCV
jgi:hypothetical protein